MEKDTYEYVEHCSEMIDKAYEDVTYWENEHAKAQQAVWDKDKILAKESKEEK